MNPAAAFIQTYFTDASSTEEPWLKPLEVIGGLIISAPIAVVSILTLRASRQRDPLDKRKIELEILEKERALGIARSNDDLETVAAVSAEPALERRKTQDIILRFVFLYLVFQVWGIVANLFGSGFGGPILGVVAAIPQVVRALILVALGWPLLLDTAVVLKVELPSIVRRPWIRWLLVAIAALAAIPRGLLLSFPF